MVLFIGDKPSLRMKPGAKPFEGALCEPRLKEWINELGIKKYSIFNSTEIRVFDRELDIMIEALLREGLITGAIPGCHWAPDHHFKAIIALGNNASKALKDIRHFKLPHPSGRNRQINDKAFIAQKLSECKEYMEGKT